MGDETAFDVYRRAQVLDHVLAVDIVAVHWLKTRSAVRETLAGRLSNRARVAIPSAVNRLFASRFKRHRARLHAHQAPAFVAREV